MQNILEEINIKVTLLGNFINSLFCSLIIVMIVICIPWLVAVLLYIVKTGLHIDFFHGIHMGKFLGL